MCGYGIIIHGGAGNSKIDPKIEYFMDVIMKTTWKMLEIDRDCTSITRHAILMMENSGLFNAGSGSYSNIDGIVEMDAGIMNDDMNCGGVGAIQGFRNPIILSEIVMNMSPHSLIVGDVGISKLIRKHNNIVNRDIITRDITYNNNSKNDEYGTVGAIVVDKRGNVCAGVSTGGLPNKHSGRVGDSALVGCGYYARDGIGAVATGDGDIMMKHHIAKECCDLVTSGYSIQDAVDKSISKMNDIEKCYGGVIAVDNNCNFGISYNTKTMSHAYTSDTVKTTISC